jgi:hypothetical protein
MRTVHSLRFSMSDYDNMNADNVKRDPKVVSALICRYIILPMFVPGGRVSDCRGKQAGCGGRGRCGVCVQERILHRPVSDRPGALTSGAFEDGEVVWPDAPTSGVTFGGGKLASGFASLKFLA